MFKDKPQSELDTKCCNKVNGILTPPPEESWETEFDEYYCAHMDFMLRDGSLARPTDGAVERMREYISRIIRSEREKAYEAGQVMGREQGLAEAYKELKK